MVDKPPRPNGTTEPPPRVFSDSLAGRKKSLWRGNRARDDGGQSVHRQRTRQCVWDSQGVDAGSAVTVKMRSLVVTPFPPARGLRDKASGVQYRLRTFVQSIAEICDETEILHFVDAELLHAFDQNSLFTAQADVWERSVNSIIALRNPWRRWHIPIAPFFLKYDSRFSSVIGKAQISKIKTRLLKQPDFVFAHRLSAMIAISQIGKRQDLPPVFFDLDDVEHRRVYRWALNAPSLSRAAYRLAGIPKIMIAERNAIRSADKTFVCSEVDQTYLARLHIRNVTVIPNAVVVPKGKYLVCPQPTVLYLGTYLYPPNVEAAERLITRIWPIVLEQNGSSHLIIAGDRPDLIPSYRLRPLNVEFTGLVSDLDALYERSRIICCPIMTGSGTRLKLIEAAAYTKPMIATPTGAEGLFFENDREILIRQSDAQIAAACSRLLFDDTKCFVLGGNAYRKAVSLYNVDIIKQKIKSELLATLRDIPQSDAPSDRLDHGEAPRT
jgi:glycosyltransferase involved in cell wall biosynthesis